VRRAVHPVQLIDQAKHGRLVPRYQAPEVAEQAPFVLVCGVELPATYEIEQEVVCDPIAPCDPLDVLAEGFQVVLLTPPEIR